MSTAALLSKQSCTARTASRATPTYLFGMPVQMLATSNGADRQRPLAVQRLPIPLLVFVILETESHRRRHTTPTGCAAAAKATACVCHPGDRVRTRDGCAVQRGVAYERIVCADAQHVLHGVLAPAKRRSQ